VQEKPCQTKLPAVHEDLQLHQLEERSLSLVRVGIDAAQRQLPGLLQGLQGVTPRASVRFRI